VLIQLPVAISFCQLHCAVAGWKKIHETQTHKELIWVIEWHNLQIDVALGKPKQINEADVPVVRCPNVVHPVTYPPFSANRTVPVSNFSRVYTRAVSL
jgi:hypothetical protein